MGRWEVRLPVYLCRLKPYIVSQLVNIGSVCEQLAQNYSLKFNYNKDVAPLSCYTFREQLKK